jgi:hypothetical protein
MSRPRRQPAYRSFPAPPPEPTGKWQDVSSYSRDDTDRTPRSMQRKVGSTIRLTVTRHIHYAPDAWVSNCEPFWTQRELAAKELPAAQAEAEQMLRDALTEALDALQP